MYCHLSCIVAIGGARCNIFLVNGIDANTPQYGGRVKVVRLPGAVPSAIVGSRAKYVKGRLLCVLIIKTR